MTQVDTMAMALDKNDATAHQCVMCPGVFYSQRQFQEHITSEHGKNDGDTLAYDCPDCGQHFLTARSLATHTRTHHALNEYDEYRCNVCFETFECKNYLSFHLETTHNKKIKHTCHFCQANFKSNAECQAHIKACEKRVDHCPLCTATFTRAKSLTDHLKNAHKMGMPLKPKEKRFKCLFCGKRYSRRQDMEVHQRTHTGDKPYKCSQCEKAFVSNAELHHHLPVHTNERAYKCQYCGAAYKNSSTLTHHKKTMHVNPSLVPCPYANCNYMGKSDKLLKSHIRYAHLEYKKIQCSLCQKTFSTKSHLYDHQRRKHGPNRAKENYTCSAPGCGKTYKLKSAAERHFRKVHLEESEQSLANSFYRCSKCTCSYEEERELREHMRMTHGSAQFYYCPVCYHVCERAKDATKHFMLHHNQAPSTASVSMTQSSHLVDLDKDAEVQYEIVADQLQPDSQFDIADSQIKNMLKTEGSEVKSQTRDRIEDVESCVSRHLQLVTEEEL